jgi:hypothetical protein
MFWSKPKQKKERTNLERISLDVETPNSSLIVVVDGTVTNMGYVHLASDRLQGIIENWFNRGFFQAQDGIIYPTSLIKTIRIAKREELWWENLI